MVSLSFDKTTFSYLIGGSVGSHGWTSSVKSKYLKNFNQWINANFKNHRAYRQESRSHCPPESNASSSRMDNISKWRGRNRIPQKTLPVWNRSK